MSMSSNKVCKYNPTGFCKYKDACKKVHENKVCEQPRTCIRKDCNERHPKTCKHFSKEEGCNFKNDCAYLHDNDKNIQQNEINHAVSVVVTKHNNEIMAIQEELKKLKDTIETMKEKMCVLEKDAQEVLKNNSIEIQEEYTPEELGRDCNKSPQKEIEKTSIEANSKESYTKGGKATKKNVQWINCEICSYKSKSENTVKKHTESKHKNIKKCTVCDEQFNSKKSFKDHIDKDHTNSHEDLHISLNSNSDLDVRLEHIEVAEYGDGESDVSIDEERMEALDREMNSGDYI